MQFGDTKTMLGAAHPVMDETRIIPVAENFARNSPLGPFLLRVKQEENDFSESRVGPSTSLMS